MEHRLSSGQSGHVHYWKEGQGDPCIVFTHGAVMDHGLFQYQIEYFSERYKVIVWDVPMHGRSRPYDGFTLQKAANELIRILDAEQAEKAHLVGQSMGGYISQIAARDHPERVVSLTAVGSSPMQPSYFSALDIWLLSITPPILRFYPYDRLIKTIAEQIAIEEEPQDYALETLKGYSRKEISEIMDIVYRGIREYGQESVLPVPILIVFGEADRTGKVQIYSRQWAEREKRSVEIIPNAGHNANMDNPHEFNRILGEFLRKIEIKIHSA